MFTRPLVYIDPQSQTPPRALDVAMKLAAPAESPIRIVAVVDDSPWAVMSHAGGASAAARYLNEDAESALEQAAKRVEASGLAVSTRLRHGQHAVEVIRESIEGNHDVVFKTMMGAEEEAKTTFGSTGRRLLRKCAAAVFLVHPQLKSIAHVVAAVGPELEGGEGAELNDRILQHANSMAREADSKLTLLHTWEAYGLSVLSKRMTLEEVEEYVSSERALAAKRLDAMAARLPGALSGARLAVEEGSATRIVPAFANNPASDVAVLGTVARSGLKGLMIGNTAEAILEHLDCSLLAVKPAGFESPVSV